MITLLRARQFEVDVAEWLPNGSSSFTVSTPQKNVILTDFPPNSFSSLKASPNEALFDS
jgi:hypothetical protein